ncbi:MAG: hypothetical protein HUU57_02405 [Bdellovibrio sp.]|nr:hypothetical protein [Bdellovibrio sp.]
MQNLKSAFIQRLKKTFPGLMQYPLESLVAENLISPFTVELDRSILAQAQKAVSLIFSMREKASYLEHYKNVVAEKDLRDPGNKSIMMSYDFHVDTNNNLKLIEINTNAAFLALGHQMYEMKGDALPVADFNLEDIKKCIVTEMQLQGKTIDSSFKISITDDAPAEQRLFIEFLVYNELFSSWGWNSQIEDYRDLFKNFQPDFIYNRYTDFFLTDSSSQSLRAKFLNRDICLSPNPFEYLLLADKQRLIDWVQPAFLEQHGFAGDDLALLKEVLPMSFDLQPENAEQIWAQRKGLFFKPKNAFGSKQSYKGGSISRKTYDDILKADMIAQQFVPPSEKTFTTPEGPQSFKFDLRCYAYQGRLQMIVARIYQGQVTNLRTPYGGFATVLFK